MEIMKKIYCTALISLLLASHSSNAAVFPEYKLATQAQPPSSSITEIRGTDYNRKNQIFYDWIGVCTDTTSRRVAGKLLSDGLCYVEWKGKIHANSDFYYLPSGGDTIGGWTPIYKGYQLDGSEITNGGRDDGEYVYHCMIENANSRVSPIKTLGKYIPGTGKCYYGQGVNRKSVKLDDFNYSLSVLHDLFYDPDPVKPPTPPKQPPRGYCDNKPKPCYEP